MTILSYQKCKNLIKNELLNKNSKDCWTTTNVSKQETVEVEDEFFKENNSFFGYRYTPTTKETKEIIDKKPTLLVSKLVQKNGSENTILLKEALKEYFANKNPQFIVDFSDCKEELSGGELKLSDINECLKDLPVMSVNLATVIAKKIEQLKPEKQIIDKIIDDWTLNKDVRAALVITKLKQKLMSADDILTNISTLRILDRIVPALINEADKSLLSQFNDNEDVKIICKKYQVPQMYSDKPNQPSLMPQQQP